MVAIFLKIDSNYKHFRNLPNGYCPPIQYFAGIIAYMYTANALIFLLLMAGAAASVYWQKLTPAAAIVGVVLGWLIYAGDGYRGLTLLALFFLTGTLATSWKKKQKLLIRGSAAHQSTRRTGQVIANAGVAAILGGLAILIPGHRPFFALLLAASLASATADTLASELGMVYGRRNFNILTWKPDERGLDGVISLEGLLIGVIGSALIALAYLLVPHLLPDRPNLPSPHNHLTSGLAYRHAALILVIAGTIGNLADSLLGALLERRNLLNNDGVNFLNTLIAAACAAALASFHG
jgi:uncharacterized protein (TIGR00297 family)